MGLVMDSDAVAQFRLLRVVRLLRLLKLARILRASRIFRRWENEVNLSYSVMSLIKFMVGVTTIAHWVRAAVCVCCSVACDVCNIRGGGFRWLARGASWWTLRMQRTTGWSRTKPTG